MILAWSKNCVLADMTVRAAGTNNDPPPIVAPNGLEFQITGTKLHVPVVPLSKENDKKLLQQNQDLKDQQIGINKDHKWLSKVTIAT